MWFAQGELERARPAVERALALARGAGEMDIVAEADTPSGTLNAPPATHRPPAIGSPPAWRRSAR